MTVQEARLSPNPLLADWTAPFGIPPFDQIAPEHFKPAFDAALSAHVAEIEAIKGDDRAPDFDNVIGALERAGQQLTRVASVFYNLTGSHTNEALQAVERDMAPVLARHYNAIHLDPDLYAKVAAVWQKRDQLGLDDEQARVLERYHTGFVRAGAALPPEQKKRLAEIGERLAMLGTQFAQNVLADEKDYELLLKDEADLAGLPDFLIDAAAQAARDRGHESGYAITLARSSIEPFLQFSTRRDLREAAFKAWSARGLRGSGEAQGRARRDIGIREFRRIPAR
jgi:peptidyl-dipeptidase Dcp